MLGALATDAKARILAGDESASLDDCVRLDGAWRRAERDLEAITRGKPESSPEGPAIPTYPSYETCVQIARGVK